MLHFHSIRPLTYGFLQTLPRGNKLAAMRTSESTGAPVSALASSVSGSLWLGPGTGFALTGYLPPVFTRTSGLLYHASHTHALCLRTNRAKPAMHQPHLQVNKTQGRQEPKYVSKTSAAYLRPGLYNIMQSAGNFREFSFLLSSMTKGCARLVVPYLARTNSIRRYNPTNTRTRWSSL